MSAVKYVAKYHGVELSFVSTVPEADRILKDFFGSHFEFLEDAESSNPLARIHLSDAPSGMDVQQFNEGVPVFLRKSVSDFFTIPALRIQQQGDEVVRCTKSGTVMRFSGDGIAVFLPVSGYKLDLIELVRDLVFKYLERSGVLVLHSTVVAAAGQAALIVGVKGAGKSTTAMQLTKTGKLEFLSGDKAFITRRNGQLMVSGWPDYPHVGIGTLRALPELAVQLGADIEQFEGRKDSEKLALDPGLFRKAIRHTPAGTWLPVRCVLYPEIDVSACVSVTALGTHRHHLSENIETAFGPHSDWNTLQPGPGPGVDHLLEELAKVPAWHVRGVGSLDAGWLVETLNA